MRTKLTLWRILDKYLDEYFKSGMCGYIERLHYYNLITLNEVVSLKKEIKSLHPDRLSFSGYYIGSPGDKEPRKKLPRKEKLSPFWSAFFWWSMWDNQNDKH